MHQIRLRHDADISVTLLPNCFIDDYMLRANGEFVKLYIFLLRCLQKGMEQIPADYLADQLLCTEGDVQRAFRYWESQGLMSLSFSPDGGISSVDIGLFPGIGTAAFFAQTETTHFEKAGAESKDGFAQADPAATYTETTPGFVKETGAFKDDPSLMPGLAVDEEPGQAERLASFMQNEDIQQIIFIAEQYLGKTLTPTEADKLIYFYDGLKMSVDLIDYLIEYCVGKGHRSIRYIEAVALSWKDDGVDSVEKAKKASFSGRKEYFSILRALGVQGRSPVESETRFMDKWLDEYQLPLTVIYEACNRTILKTGQPSFPYTDRILSDWSSAGVSSPEDIARLDEAHHQVKPKKASKSGKQQAASQGAQGKGNSKFHNFSQRDYDYSDVEKQLLHLDSGNQS